MHRAVSECYRLYCLMLGTRGLPVPIRHLGLMDLQRGARWSALIQANVPIYGIATEGGDRMESGGRPFSGQNRCRGGTRVKMLLFTLWR